MEQSILSQQDKDQIKSRLKKLKFNATPSAPAPAPVVKKKDNFGTIFLGTVMFLLSVMLMYLFVFKVSSNFESEATTDNEQYYDAQESPSTISGDVEKLKAAVERLSKQIWVLGVQANQNTAITKMMDREFHQGKYADRFVYLKEDWKLDKKPDYIKFDEEGLKKLQNSLD